jgi:hypothetical protein
MIHFVLSLENQNYTKKQGALAIEQNVMKTLFLKMKKSLRQKTKKLAYIVETNFNIWIILNTNGSTYYRINQK